MLLLGCWLSEKKAKVLLGLESERRSAVNRSLEELEHKRAQPGQTESQIKISSYCGAAQSSISETPSPSFVGLSEADVFCGLAAERPSASIF